MRVMDLLFTFPGILLAMLIIAMLGVNTFNAMLAISIWSIPSFARMVRGKVLQVKEEDYIMATRSLGAQDSRIIFVHILKNCLPVIIVIATMRMATSIISISTLSYLGMGVTPPMPGVGRDDRHWQAVPVGPAQSHFHPRHRSHDHRHLLQYFGG